MEKSPTITELAKALVQFQGEVKTIGYDAANPFFKSSYATLATLVENTKDILSKNGLVVSQLCEDEGSVTTMLIHTSGEYISSKLTLKPVKDDPQGRGSCLTYSRRYSYASILGLVSDKDDDANAATHGYKATVNAQDLSGEITDAQAEALKKIAFTKFKGILGFNGWLKQTYDIQYASFIPKENYDKIKKDLTALPEVSKNA